MLSEKEIYKFIKALILRIKYIEDNDPYNPNLDKLKLLLLDNVTEEGKIRIKTSLLNKQAHLFFSNCTNHMHKYKKGHLYN